MPWLRSAEITIPDPEHSIDETHYLLALNPNWPERIIAINEKTAINGVLIFSGTKRR